MNIPSKNIQTILEAETDLVFKQTLFRAREPESPSVCTTLFDTPDAGRFKTYDKTEKYDYAGVQVRVRNPNSDAAFAKAQEIVDVLDRINSRIVNGDSVSVLSLDNPSLLDWDDNDRARVIANFQVQQTPA